MSVRRLSGLVTLFLLSGFWLTGASPVCARLQLESTAATHSGTHDSASHYSSVGTGSQSSKGSHCGGDSDCCQMMGGCASLLMPGESQERIPSFEVPARILTKNLFAPPTPALGVETPPPKA